MSSRSTPSTSTQITAADGPARLPRDGIFRILLCRTSHSLGNTLFMTPLIQELQRQWPGAEIDIVTRFGPAARIFKGYPQVRNVFVLPKAAFRKPLRWIGTLRDVWREEYDLVIDADQQSRTGQMIVGRSNARHRLGFAGRAATVGVDGANAPRHSSHFPVYLLRQALSQPGDDYPLLSMQLTERERGEGRQRLHALIGDVPPDKRGVIGIFGNATGGKAMTPQWWSTFVAAADPYLKDFVVVEVIPAFGRSLLGNRYPAYFSSDIRALSKFLSSLTMLISLDCGIMHLARASGTPVTAIFTGTDVDRWGPYGPGAEVIESNRESAADAGQQIVARFTNSGAPLADRT